MTDKQLIALLETITSSLEARLLLADGKLDDALFPYSLEDAEGWREIKNDKDNALRVLYDAIRELREQVKMLKEEASD